MIKIVDVNISSAYSWGNIKDLRDWNSFKNTSENWQQTRQTAIVSHDVLVIVQAVEDNWLGLMEINKTWEDVFNNYNNWSEVSNF